MTRVSERSARDSIQSVERAFTVLGALASGPAPLSVVARDVELPLSTVSRLLSTLESIGAVARADDGAWSIGPAIHALGAADPDAALVAAARPHLEALVAATGETAGISVRDGDVVRYLDHVAAEQDVQIKDWTGTSLPLHLVSSGQVLLAHAPAEVVERYLAGPLGGPTTRSLTTADALRERLAAVRRDGWSVTDRELSDEIASVAAPVHGPAGVVAALHVHGPAYRFPEAAARAALVGAVVTAAANMAAARFASLVHTPSRSTP